MRHFLAQKCNMHIHATEGVRSPWRQSRRWIYRLSSPPASDVSAYGRWWEQDLFHITGCKQECDVTNILSQKGHSVQRSHQAGMTIQNASLRLQWVGLCESSFLRLEYSITRGQSNLTKSASRRAHSPVRGHPRGSGVESCTIEFLG